MKSIIILWHFAQLTLGRGLSEKEGSVRMRGCETVGCGQHKTTKGNCVRVCLRLCVCVHVFVCM